MANAVIADNPAILGNVNVYLGDSPFIRGIKRRLGSRIKRSIDITIKNKRKNKAFPTYVRITIPKVRPTGRAPKRFFRLAALT